MKMRTIVCVAPGAVAVELAEEAGVLDSIGEVLLLLVVGGGPLALAAPT